MLFVSNVDIFLYQFAISFILNFNDEERVQEMMIAIVNYIACPINFDCVKRRRRFPCKCVMRVALSGIIIRLIRFAIVKCEETSGLKWVFIRLAQSLFCQS